MLHSRRVPLSRRDQCSPPLSRQVRVHHMPAQSQWLSSLDERFPGSAAIARAVSLWCPPSPARLVFQAVGAFQEHCADVYLSQRCCAPTRRNEHATRGVMVYHATANKGDVRAIPATTQVEETGKIRLRERHKNATYTHTLT